MSSPNDVISEKFTWEASAITDTGAVRKVNEDAIMSNTQQGHWAVADGMGGHNAGDLASSEICKSLQSLEQSGDFPSFIDAIEVSVRDVNSRLVDIGEKDASVIGSTVVGIAFFKDHVVSYWAGDSRAYLFRDGKLRMITIDHTVVQELLESKVIAEHEVSTHPDKNIITRAVGSDRQLYLDFTIESVRDRDLFLVCSDGVEKELSDDELEALLNENHPTLDACNQTIVDEVLQRGARDNVSMIMIKFTGI